MRLSEYDRNHIPAILADAKGERYHSFSNQLLRLIAKADQPNLERLRTVYPEHVEAYEDWYFGQGAYYTVPRVGAGRFA